MTAPESADTSSQVEPQADETSSSNDELSPEALRAELKRARDEAAKYRQRAREFGDDEQYKRAKEAVAAVEKAEQEKKTEVERLSEEREKLMYQANTAEQQLTRLRIALGAGIDPSQVDEFASRLRGDDDDELRADAEKLVKFFAPAAPARRGDPSQGAGGESEPDKGGLHAALTAIARR